MFGKRKKKGTNASRDEFEQDRLAQIAQQWQWRGWTDTLLVNTLAELEVKLAAGDIPIADGPQTPTEDDRFAPPPAPQPLATAPTLETEDEFEAFMGDI